jgi:hypothetical protein
VGAEAAPSASFDAALAPQSHDHHPTPTAPPAGDDALIGIAPLLDQPNCRKRGAHAALGAIAVADGRAWVLRAQDIKGNGGLYLGASKAAKAAKPVPRNAAGTPGAMLDERQAVHALAFAECRGGSTWLAAGNAAGFVRLMRVSGRLR